MGNIFATLKDDSGMSKLEVSLAIMAAGFAGVIIGGAVGTLAAKPPRAPKKIVFKEIEIPNTENKILSREDYE